MPTRRDRFGIEEMRHRFGRVEGVPLSRIEAYYREKEPDISSITVRWRLTALRGFREVSSVARGVYRLERTRDFHPRPTTSLREVSDLLKKVLPAGTDFCVWTTAWIRRFAGRGSLPLSIVVQVPREWVETVAERLRDDERSAFVEPFVIGSPVRRKGKVPLPKIEKLVVDAYCLFVRDGDPSVIGQSREAAATAASEAVRIATGVYGMNRTTMLRYARNRGVREDVERLLDTAGTGRRRKSAAKRRRMGGNQ